jgi:ribose-phosphate pyrophosphokinase
VYRNIFDDERMQLSWITMPDGMPHFTLKKIVRDPHIFARIKTGDDLVRLCMLLDTITKNGATQPIVEILYMSAQRMDRMTEYVSPWTEKVFLDILAEYLNVSDVWIHCPHSESFFDLLVNKKFAEKNTILPIQGQEFFYNSISEYKNVRDDNFPTIVIPDKGAVDRFNFLRSSDTVLCEKVREPNGKLTGFTIVEGKPTNNCLILDDLCDGGGTFAGTAKLLKENGAKHVGLAVYHGIFSKLLPIPNIDWVATTNSFRDEQMDGINFFYDILKD